MIKIGLLAEEFLINIGANDFLKNIIRGLDSIKGFELYFICPEIETLNLSSYDLSQKYSYYADASARMVFMQSKTDSSSLIKIKKLHDIDVFMPSIHPLSNELQYITYWPDCQPKHFPEFFNDEAQHVRDAMINKLLDTKMPMIINSQSARKDMCKFYSANPSQIHALPFAPIIEFDKLTAYPELLNEYNLPKKYFIVSNQFWIHKSIETVIEAVGKLASRGFPVHVVFTGKMEEPRRPEYIAWLISLTEQCNAKQHINFLGYIPKSHQIEIMKWSIAVVQPTLFEGGPGGGSVYDAISLGCRAIVSDISVNQEISIGKNQITYFKAKDSESLAKEMHLLSLREYQFPSPEALYQQSKKATVNLGIGLQKAINSALK